MNFWVPLHNCPLEGPQTLCSHSLLALFLRRILCQALWGFPGGSDGKESACNVGDPGSIPRLGRSPGEGNGNPLQYCCLENPIDGRAWLATVCGVAKSWTRLRNFTFFHLIRGFGTVNKAGDVFLELSCFFYDPMDVGNLISGSSFLKPA